MPFSKCQARPVQFSIAYGLTYLNLPWVHTTFRNSLGWILHKRSYSLWYDDFVYDCEQAQVCVVLTYTHTDIDSSWKYIGLLKFSWNSSSDLYGLLFVLQNCKTSFCDLVHKTSFVLKDTQSGIIINNWLHAINLISGLNLRSCCMELL